MSQRLLLEASFSVAELADLVFWVVELDRLQPQITQFQKFQISLSLEFFVSAGEVEIDRVEGAAVLLTRTGPG